LSAVSTWLRKVAVGVCAAIVERQASLAPISIVT
jgi:hypothetical protein